MTPGKRIRELRQSRKISQKDLAAAVECSCQVISNIERDYSGISADMIDRLATYFDVPSDYILGTTTTASSRFVTLQNDDEVDLIQGYRKMGKRQRRMLLGAMEEILLKDKE